MAEIHFKFNYLLNAAIVFLRAVIHLPESHVWFGGGGTDVVCQTGCCVLGLGGRRMRPAKTLVNVAVAVNLRPHIATIWINVVLLLRL